jgi:hypothetical protein
MVFDPVYSTESDYYYDGNIFEEICYEKAIQLYELLAIHFFHVFASILILPPSMEFGMVVLVAREISYFMYLFLHSNKFHYFPFSSYLIQITII